MQWCNPGGLQKHTGAAEIAGDGSKHYNEGYTTLVSTQRVMSVACGGQVLLSQTTRELLQNVLPTEVSLRDLGEHRLKDLRSPLHLYQLVAPGLPQDFPGLKSLNNLPNNLPIQLARFVGRGQELSEVERLLSGTRLLTLTGPGGLGKTRLALQAEVAVLEQFPQGAWLVELAPVTDPQILVQVVADIFAVREIYGQSLLEALIDFLRYKALLLVLDNCEHLIEACAQLTDNLLHGCPNLKILAKGLIFYWVRSGLGTEGLRWLGTAVTCLPDTPPADSGASLDQAARQRQAIQAYLFSGAAMLAVNLGYSLPAIQFSNEAEFWACASSNQHALCLALAIKVLSKANLEENTPQLLAAAEENLTLAHQLGDEWLQCIILRALARLAFIFGDQAALSGYMQEHARLARQVKNRGKSPQIYISP